MVSLSDRAWTLAKQCAEKGYPKTSRPNWIEKAIYEQAKREGIEDVVPVPEKMRSKGRKQV